jgi:hypothetical protein
MIIYVGRVHYEVFTLSPEVISLLTHYQGMSAEFTMKSFKGSSKKLGSLGFQLASRCRNPILNGTIPLWLY